MKICSKCKEEKPYSDFNKAARYKDGYKSACKKCLYADKVAYRANGGLEKERAKEAERRAKDPDRSKKRHLKHSYDLTLEQYDAMFNWQIHCCYLCKVPASSGRRFVIDHDHETGKNRAILCNSCNVGIGLLNDSPELLEAAAEYIRYFKTHNITR